MFLWSIKSSFVSQSQLYYQPWALLPLLTSEMQFHCSSRLSFHSETWMLRKGLEYANVLTVDTLVLMVTLLSPPDTARMLPDTDQLTCQTTSSKEWSSFWIHWNKKSVVTTDGNFNLCSLFKKPDFSTTRELARIQSCKMWDLRASLTNSKRRH